MTLTKDLVQLTNGDGREVSIRIGFTIAAQGQEILPDQPLIAHAVTTIADSVRQYRPSVGEYSN